MMVYMGPIFQQARALIHQRQRELSLMHVMLFWADQELDKVQARTERLGGGIIVHESRLDPDIRRRIMVVLEALKISPIDIDQVEKFGKLLEESSSKKVEDDATSKEAPG